MLPTCTVRRCPLTSWLNSNEGTKSLTGFFATFYARRTFGNLRFLILAHVCSADFGGLIQTVSWNRSSEKSLLSQNGSPHGFYHWALANRRIRRLSSGSSI